MADRAAALLLDLDGTLVDSEGFHREVFLSWLAGRGWSVDEDVLAAFTGRRADDVFAVEPGPWAGEDIATMMAELLGHMATLPRPDLAPGAADLIGSATVPLALVTSATPGWARTCLGELLDRFEVVVTRDEVTDGKPHPEPYALACTLLGLAPAGCVAVEDTPAGLASAVAAGVGLVVGISGTFPAADLVDAHRVVGSLAEVGPLL
jgi:sugar-phosphatase